jgi:drug/metabolite transporter (DMT)-like permease
MLHRRRLVGELMLVVATVIWGGTFAVTRGGLTYISPVLLIAIRFLLSFLVLAPAVTFLRIRWWRGAGPGVILGLALAAGYLLQTTGLHYTSAARSAFITYLFAIFIPPLQYFVSRRKLSTGNLLGLAIVVGGTLVLTRPWQTSGWNRGDLLTLGSAVAFAIFIVGIDRFAQERDPITFVPTQFLVAGLVSLSVGMVGKAMWIAPHPALWAAMAYLTLLGTAGALGIQTVFQFRTTPVRATTIYALEPVFAALFGMAILSERMGAVEIVGAAIILLGVLTSELWEVVGGRMASRPR